MKPLKSCANGCKKPVQPPSLVLCKDCLDGIDEKFEKIIKDLGDKK